MPTLTTPLLLVPKPFTAMRTTSSTNLNNWATPSLDLILGHLANAAPLLTRPVGAAALPLALPEKRGALVLLRTVSLAKYTVRPERWR